MRKWEHWTDQTVHLCAVDSEWDVKDYFNIKVEDIKFKVHLRMNSLTARNETVCETSLMPSACRSCKGMQEAAGDASPAASYYGNSAWF